ncbi:MAG: threonylcarbamoyl-AMP synthase [Endomicrobium sp.]|jgi:L-threonylcarbamoyladenylate synthase|nr:threonylcarbamoyl-AMP synthase [Endomicrobium sp.]
MSLKVLSIDKDVYKKVSEVIKSGGIAIVPTETVYGFVVDAFNFKAQKTLYKIKNRNAKKPLVMMAYDIKRVRVFVDISDKASRIAQRFWPGQLTLIFPTTEMGQILSGGRKDLGVRIPNNKFMLRLLREMNGPVFTTSVNVSNEKSAKNISEVLKFGKVVDVIVDGGQCEFSFESTVIDMIRFPYVIIRKGCLNTDKVLEYL